MFTNNAKRKFLFKCEDCLTILSVDLDDEEDLEEVQEDKFEFKCPCDGRCVILRD